MRYIALLRGINVGGHRKVEMKKLRELFETLGYLNVSTYINSGNIVFDSDQDRKVIYQSINMNLEKVFSFQIPIILKTIQEMKGIADAVPKKWQNDPTQKSDVAYLFPEIDNENIIDKLPVKKEYIDIHYTCGALYWNVERKNQNKSQLNNLAGHKIYKLMTVRNINTARYLAGYR